MIAGILTFMSMINFMLRYGEHEKSFKTSGPDVENRIHHSEKLIKFCYLSNMGNILKITSSGHRGLNLGFVSFRPSQHIFSHVGTGLSVINQFYAGDKVPRYWTQRSASSEARTRNPSIPVEHAMTEPMR